MDKSTYRKHRPEKLSNFQLSLFIRLDLGISFPDTVALMPAARWRYYKVDEGKQMTQCNPDAGQKLLNYSLKGFTIIKQLSGSRNRRKLLQCPSAVPLCLHTSHGTGPHLIGSKADVIRHPWGPSLL